MLNCSKCGKTNIQEIVTCELQATGLCQFNSQVTRYGGSSWQGWLIIILALIFILLVLVFPGLPESVVKGSAFYGLAYSLFLGLLLFAGVATIVVGLLIIFAKQTVTISLADGQSYQENRLWSRIYRTRFIQALSIKKFSRKESLLIPASILSVGNFENLTTVVVELANKKNIKSISDIKQQSINNLAQKAFIAAIFDLLNRGLIACYKGQIYHSDAENIEHTRDTLESLFLPTQNNAGILAALGELENKIYKIVSDWKSAANWLDSPLAPGIKDILHALCANETFPAKTILNSVATNPISSVNNDQLIQELASLNDIIADNSGLYDEFRTTSNIVLQTSNQHLKQKLFSLSNPVFMRYVRNSLIVAIILLFTAGRWLLGVDLISDIGKHYISSSDIKVHSELVVSASKDQAHSKLWGLIRWIDKKLWQAENWIKGLPSGRQAALQIQQLLALGDVESRRKAARLLYAAEQHSTETIDFFRALIQDSDSVTRQTALQALNSFDSASAALIPDMVKLLGSDSFTADLSAKNLVQHSEKKSLELETQLNSALKEQDIAMQKRIKRLLAELGW